MRSAAFVVVVTTLSAATASAHDFNPGVLALHERAVVADTSARFYDVVWTQPVDSRGARANVAVVWPGGCALDDDNDEHNESSTEVLRCSGPIAGTLAFTGIEDPSMQVIVAIRSVHDDDYDGVDGGGGIERSSGSSLEEHIVTGAAPSVTVGNGHGQRSLLAWVLIGVEHILFGLDHVAFVLSLLLLLGARLDRRLLLTLTSFTVAHSLTLALAALDVVVLPSAPVEACIALSVLLVAREALTERKTAMRTAPWLVAGAFGLVHGLGFAGALSELGLPRDSIASSLLCFNVGVELGQLVIVAVVVVVVALVARALRATTRGDGARATFAMLSRRFACTVIGAVVAYWLIERTLAILHV